MTTVPATATASVASGQPAAAAPWYAMDLGTLGGARSEASAVSGDIVAGWSDTSTGTRHAFAYDLGAPNPHMVDLGTMGGPTSSVSAVSGNLIVGDSDTSTTNVRHGFAYDLGAPNPHMVDLGTLGGSYTHVQTLSGHVVIGSSSPPGDTTHQAFVEDLGAPNPHMVDIGSLTGGSESEALGVNGTVVVGQSHLAGGAGHAWVYDLAAPNPTPVDLGTFGGNFSQATATNGTIVVGSAMTANNENHPFAYDLSAATPHLIDLGTLGGTWGGAGSVSGSIVGGSSNTAGNAENHLFIYDLAAASPHMVDLGILGYPARAFWGGISGTVVTVYSNTAGSTATHAFAYDLAADSPHMVDLGALGGSDNSVSAISGDVVVGIAFTAAGIPHAGVWSHRDRIRPTLRVTHVPDGENGWNVADPATLHISASDADSGLTSPPACTDNGSDLTVQGEAPNFTAPVTGPGAHSITCTATDYGGNSTTSGDTLRIEAPTDSGFTSADHASFTEAAAGTFQVEGGGAAPVSFTAAGLPAWLSLTDQGAGRATLDGSPPIGGAGEFHFSITKANPTGSVTQAFTLTVSPRVPDAGEESSFKQFTLGPADADMGGVSMSTDGRFVAFLSPASNLVPNDTNGRLDVFVYDRTTGQNERVDVTSGGAQGSADGDWHMPYEGARGDDRGFGISGTGRYVVFTSSAPLAPGTDGDGPLNVAQIYLRDRVAGTTGLISVNASGNAGDAASDHPVMSADGRFIAFSSASTNLGDTSSPDGLWIRDRQANTTELVDPDTAGTEVKSISADGRYILFASNDGGLYMRDRVSHTTESVDQPPSGESFPWNGDAANMSQDGRYVVWGTGDESDADVYVRDMTAETTEQINASTDGTRAQPAAAPWISGNGHFVAFTSNVPSVPGSPARSNVYIYDRESHLTTLATIGVDGSSSNSMKSGMQDIHRERGWVSNNGIVAVATRATNLTGRTQSRCYQPDQYYFCRQGFVADLNAKLGIPAPPVDTDGDGIDDDVDVNPAGVSASFDDHGGTAGTVTDAAGLSVTVADAPTPDGVTVTVGAGSGQVSLQVCTGFTVKINAGSTITLTCGSVLLKVTQGAAHVVLGGGVTTVDVPAGVTGEVSDNGDGTFTVQNLAGTADVTITAPSGTRTVPTGGTVTVPVAPVELTVAAPTGQRPYADANPVLSAVVTGFVNGDTESVLTSPPVCTTSARTGSHVGSYPVTCTGAAADHYTFRYVDGALSVTPATLRVNAPGPGTLYGEAVPALSPAISGYVNGDGPNALDTAPTCTTTATPASHVGDYTVSCAHGAAADYQFSYVKDSLTISAAPLTLTANNTTITYGQHDPAFTFSVQGLVGNDTLTTAPTCTVPGTHLDAGSYPISCSGADAESDYTVNAHPGVLTIGKAAVTVTADSLSRRYGQPDPALTYATTGLVGADTLTTPPHCAVAGDDTNVGTHPISCPGASAGPNYTVTDAPGALDVTRAPVVIVATSASALYGDPSPAFGSTSSGLVAPDTLVTPPSCGVTGAHTAAGDYPVTCTGADAGNNYDLSYVDGTFSVHTAKGVITPVPQSKTYGTADPTFTFTVSGLVPGEQLLTAPTCAPPTPHLNTGSYPISCSGALAGLNYTLDQTTTAALTVTPAAVVITPDNKSSAYGQPDPVFNYNTTGLVGNDTLTHAPVCGVPAAHSQAGTYPIVCSGADGGANYTVTATSATFTVRKSVATVVPNNQASTYGQTTPTLSFTVTGLVGTDTLPTAPVCTAATPHVNAGSYPITCAGATGGQNYTIDQTGVATLTIAKAPLTVAVNNASKLLNATNPALTGTLVGVVNHDTITAAYATTAVTLSPVGTYPITATLTGPALANYQLTHTPGTLTVSYGVRTLAASLTYGAHGAAGVLVQLVDATGHNVDSPSIKVTATALDGKPIPPQPSEPGNAFTLVPVLNQYAFAMNTSNTPTGTHVLTYTAGNDPITHTVTITPLNLPTGRDC